MRGYNQEINLSVLWSTMKCIKYIKTATKAVWFYGCNFIAEWSGNTLRPFTSPSLGR